MMEARDEIIDEGGDSIAALVPEAFSHDYPAFLTKSCADFAHSGRWVRSCCAYFRPPDLGPGAEGMPPAPKRIGQNNPSNSEGETPNSTINPAAIASVTLTTGGTTIRPAFAAGAATRACFSTMR